MANEREGQKNSLGEDTGRITSGSMSCPDIQSALSLPSASYNIMGLLFRQKGTLIFITLLDNPHLTNHRCVALRSITSQVGFPSSQSGLHEFKRSILATDKLQG